jgi:hypothetical protein
MSERAIFFKDLSEILIRERFSLQNGIAVESFQSLIGPYHFVEEAHCQVVRNSVRCNEGHRKGWLGRRNDGEEALIGGDCAIKYFNANAEFQMERKRVDLEARIDGHIMVLTRLLQDKIALMDRVIAALERIKLVRERVRGYQNILSNDATKRLNDMVKTGNRNAIVELRYVEETEQGKEKIVWRQRDIGAIQGITVWDGAVTTGLYTTLGAIKDTIDKAKISTSEKERNLRHWRETLEELPHCEERITALERALLDFCTPANATLLSVLGRAQTNRADLCGLVLKTDEELNPSIKKISALVAEVNARIKHITDGREYRGV